MWHVAAETKAEFEEGNWPNKKEMRAITAFFCQPFRQPSSVRLLPSHLPSPLPYKSLESVVSAADGARGESSQVLLHGDGEHASLSFSNIGRYVMMRARFMHPSRIGTSGHFFTVNANTSVAVG